MGVGVDAGADAARSVPFAVVGGVEEEFLRVTPEPAFLQAVAEAAGAGPPSRLHRAMPEGATVSQARSSRASC